MTKNQRFKFHGHCEFKNFEVCILSESVRNSMRKWQIKLKSRSQSLKFSIKKQMSPPKFKNKIISGKRIQTGKGEMIKCPQADFLIDYLSFKLPNHTYLFLFFLEFLR